MKRKTAKEILVESFQELSAGKNIEKITVKEITDNCGYSTATFYRQFRDKYDLIVWNYAQQVKKIMERVGKGEYVWNLVLMEVLDHLLKEKEYLTNILTHTGGHDSFIRNMTEIHEQELTAYIKKITGQDKIEKSIRLCIHLYCMGTVCLCCEWILGAIEATAEELAEILEKSVPDPLRAILPK